MPGTCSCLTGTYCTALYCTILFAMYCTLTHYSFFAKDCVILYCRNHNFSSFSFSFLLYFVHFVLLTFFSFLFTLRRDKVELEEAKSIDNMSFAEVKNRSCHPCIGKKKHNIETKFL